MNPYLKNLLNMPYIFISSNKAISFVFVFSIIIMIFRIFNGNAANYFYNNNPPLEYKIFDGIYWLAASYIVSFLMYLFVVDIPERTKKKKLLPFISSKTKMIVGDAQSILNDITREKKVEITQSVTKEFIEKLFKSISPNEKAPLINSHTHEYENWVGLFFSQRERSKQNIQIIFRYLLFMDSEHIRLISRIDDCIFFSQVGNLYGHKITNPDLSFLSDCFYNYYLATLELDQYIEKNLKGFAWSERRI